MAWRVTRAERPATVLAIGTAVSPTIHEQSTYPDYYFEATTCNHKTELKAKFKRICE
jgi:chalcone synthase